MPEARGGRGQQHDAVGLGPAIPGRDGGGQVGAVGHAREAWDEGDQRGGRGGGFDLGADAGAAVGEGEDVGGGFAGYDPGG